MCWFTILAKQSKNSKIAITQLVDTRGLLFLTTNDCPQNDQIGANIACKDSNIYITKRAMLWLWPRSFLSFTGGQKQPDSTRKFVISSSCFPLQIGALPFLHHKFCCTPLRIFYLYVVSFWLHVRCLCAHETTRERHRGFYGITFEFSPWTELLSPSPPRHCAPSPSTHPSPQGTLLHFLPAPLCRSMPCFFGTATFALSPCGDCTYVLRIYGRALHARARSQKTGEFIGLLLSFPLYGALSPLTPPGTVPLPQNPSTPQGTITSSPYPLLQIDPLAFHLHPACHCCRLLLCCCRHRTLYCRRRRRRRCDCRDRCWWDRCPHCCGACSDLVECPHRGHSWRPLVSPPRPHL